MKKNTILISLVMTAVMAMSACSSATATSDSSASSEADATTTTTSEAATSETTEATTSETTEATTETTAVTVDDIAEAVKKAMGHGASEFQESPYYNNDENKASGILNVRAFGFNDMDGDNFLGGVYAYLFELDTESEKYKSLTEGGKITYHIGNIPNSGEANSDASNTIVAINGQFVFVMNEVFDSGKSYNEKAPYHYENAQAALEAFKAFNT